MYDSYNRITLSCNRLDTGASATPEWNMGLSVTHKSFVAEYAKHLGKDLEEDSMTLPYQLVVHFARWVRANEQDLHTYNWACRFWGTPS